MYSVKLSLLFLFSLTITTTLAVELRTLQTLVNYLGADFLQALNNKTKDASQMTTLELGQSRGQCNYDFMDVATLRFERYECALGDRNITHLLPKKSSAGSITKPPIMVKCLAQNLTSASNSSWNGTLQIISSVKDVVTLLKPIGNATKRHEEGSCVLLFFFTETSLGCSLVAPSANKLPKQFPMLRVAAIDGYKFPSFNTEFGIVGLPTLLLFHQGRPIVKFYSDEGSYGTFVMRHTGIQPAEIAAGDDVAKGPLPLTPVQKPDYYLVLAWGFIILCLGNYFAKSRLCLQIIEMIKRNWRESEAQLEHN